MDKKIKCEIEGYEHLKFEVGQQWRTRGGAVVTIARVYDDSFNYPVETETISYTTKGLEHRNKKSENDLVDLVVTEEAEWVTEQDEEPITEQDVEQVTGLDREQYRERVITETSVEDKMVDILHQLLRQRNRDLERLSLMFNTFMKLEKMKQND